MSIQDNTKQTTQVHAIEYLNEFKLTKKDLSILDDEVVAAIAVLCFAVTEINSLMRLYIFSASERSFVRCRLSG